jgi:dienelactone hydrolase
MKYIKSIMSAVVMIAIVACGSSEKKEEQQEVVIEEEVNIRGEEVTYSSPTTEMKGYMVYDEAQSGKRPGVIVVHEWWGHNDYTRERADMLAELGYVALAVDMYGEGKQAEHPEDAGKFSGMVMSNLDEAKARFDAALETLKANPMVDQEQIAAIGYCFGGSVVLSMANAGYDLDAVAAFHAGVQLPIPPSEEIKAKILVAQGADDPFVSAESVVAYKEAMDAVGADYTYIDYPGAVHAFTSKGADALGEQFELPLKYQKEADEASWAELQKLFDSVFK